MEKQWYLYILECGDGTLYTGVTDNIPRRVAAHNAGKGAKYTRGRGPVKLRYQVCCGTRGDALRQECRVKALTRAEKLELIETAPEG